MADAPFGTSFGDPRKYIGQSGIGQAVKTGLTAYAMQKSGLTDWLNSLNKKPDQTPAVPGAVPPNAQAVAPVPPQGAVPATPSQMPESSVPPITPAPMTPQQTAPQNPAQLGSDWLSGKVSEFTGSSFVNPQASRDIEPMQGGGYTQQLAGANDYQNTPGYGKLMKTVQALFG